MKPPCEIVVWYVIPSIRSKLAKELLNLGMKQKDISELLDITQPAVSQYISDKRGHELDFDPVVEQYIKNMARDIKNGELEPIDLIPRFCHIRKFSVKYIKKRLIFHNHVVCVWEVNHQMDVDSYRHIHFFSIFTCRKYISTIIFKI